MGGSTAEWVGVAFFFGLAAIFCFVMLQFDAARQRRREERERLFDSESEDIILDPPELAAPTVTHRDVEQIQPELRRAGFYSPRALQDYRTTRRFLIVLPLLFAVILGLAVQPDRVLMVLMIGGFLAVLGFSLPRVYVTYQARYRVRQLERGLPVAVDLLTLGLLAGQNIHSAFNRVARELRHSFPVVAEEMELVRRQAELNTLTHAVDLWADRVQMPEVRNLALIISQSERQGIDISNSLLEFANDFRTRLRQRADASANRASVWMLFPTVFFLWLPAAAILAAPIYFDFWDRQKKAREALLPPGGDPNDKSLPGRFGRYMKANTPPPPPPPIQSR